MLLVFIFVVLLLIVILIVSCVIKFYITINDNGYKITICFFIFEKICIYKSNLNSLIKRFKKSKSRSMKDIKTNLKIIRKLNVKADKIYSKIYICTSEVQSTAIITGILNSIIGITFSGLNIKITKDNFIYKVIPIYSNKKVLHIKIKCIFSSSLVHIISTFIRTKIGDVRNGR